MLEDTGVKEALAFLGERCQMDRIRLQNGLQDLKNLTLEVKNIEREFVGKVDSMYNRMDSMYNKLVSMYNGKDSMYSGVDEVRNHSMVSGPAQWLALDMGIVKLENLHAVLGIGCVVLLFCLLFLLCGCLVKTRGGKRRREIMKVRAVYNEVEEIWDLRETATQTYLI